MKVLGGGEKIGKEVNAKASLTSYKKHAKRFKTNMGVGFTFFPNQPPPSIDHYTPIFCALQVILEHFKKKGAAVESVTTFLPLLFIKIQ